MSRHHQEVVAGGGEGNAEVLRGAPAPGRGIFPGNIEVVSAHPVESVGGEIQGVSVGGEHWEDFISGAHQPLVKDLRARPCGIPFFRQVQVPHPGSVRGGEDAAACPLGQIQGEGTADRVQRIRRAAPGFVLEGIVEEKVFPGEGLPGDHFRVGAGSGHIQRVLGLVDAAVDLLLGFQAEGAAEGGQIGGQGFFELVAAVEAVSPVERLLGGNNGSPGQDARPENKPYQDFPSYAPLHNGLQKYEILPRNFVYQKKNRKFVAYFAVVCPAPAENDKLIN